MRNKSASQLGLFGPGELPGDCACLAEDWREVEVPVNVLAQMLGCRATNLRQNYGDALVPGPTRGTYRLETVLRAIQRLQSRRGRSGRTTEEELEYQRLRNGKLRAETHRIELATRDYVARIKGHARTEVLDEMADLAARLRDEVRSLPAELMAVHNRWIEDLATRLDAMSARQAQVTEEDREAIQELRHDE